MATHSTVGRQPFATRDRKRTVWTRRFTRTIVNNNKTAVQHTIAEQHQDGSAVRLGTERLVVTTAAAATVCYGCGAFVLKAGLYRMYQVRMYAAATLRTSTPNHTRWVHSGCMSVCSRGTDFVAHTPPLMPILGRGRRHVHCARLSRHAKIVAMLLLQPDNGFWESSEQG